MWSKRRSRYSSQWPEYVPVAERRARAARQMKALQKKGQALEPVQIEGRSIAQSFWGKGWCTHLESFGDYSNRLPRGRTYVRNGSVCHLGIERGRVEAAVAGSMLYQVRVDIEPLQPKAWAALKQQCAGRIGSLIELLQGRLSAEVMTAVIDHERGLFPKPGEIRYTCNCPDYADMCKHIAAVMYGIGARLDTQPELLFKLRGVDHAELLGAEAAVGAIAGSGGPSRRRRVLAEGEISAVFGVELEQEAVAEQPPAPNAVAPRPRKQRTISRLKQKQPKADPARNTNRRPFKPTGRAIADLRRRKGLSRAEFAAQIGVSPATVTKWEQTKGTVKPHAKGRAGLQRLSDE